MGSRIAGRSHRSSLLAAAVVPLAFLTSCASGPGTVVIDGDPADVLARAAEADVGTIEFRLDVRLTSEVFEVTQTVTGIVTPSGDSHLRQTVAWDVPGERELPEEMAEDVRESLNGTSETISLDGAVYQRREEFGGRPLPDGIEWTVNRGSAPGSPGMSSVSIDAGGYLEPLDLLQLLATARDVEDRGSTELDGRPVRWLHAVLPPSEDAEHDEPADVDVYLDQHERVRRVVWVVTRGEGEELHHTEVTMDYLDLDSPEQVTAPPAAVTVDEYELSEELRATPAAP